MSHGFDSAWDTTTSADRLRMRTSRQSTAQTNKAGPADTSVTVQNLLIRQYVSDRLDGAQTITGTVKGQIRAYESSTAADMRAQVVIRVIADDGTVRGTLLAADSGALVSEFSTSATNRRFPTTVGQTLTSVDALDGDRIVVEIGARAHNTVTTSYTPTAVFGDAATDLAEDETSTAANAPWIEFSQAFTIKSAALLNRASMEVLIRTAGAARLNRSSMEVLIRTIASGRLNRSSMEVLIAPGGHKFRWGMRLGTALPAANVKAGAVQLVNGSSANITLPAGAAMGDTLLIMAGHGYAVNTPTGFTALDAQSGSNWNGGVFTKTATASDVTTGYITVSFSNSYNGTVGIVAFNGTIRGFRDDRMIRSSTGAASVAVTSNVAAVPQDIAIYFGSNRATSSNTVDRGSVLGTASGANGSVILAYEVIGSSGTVTATFSHSIAGSGYYDGIVIARST